MWRTRHCTFFRSFRFVEPLFDGDLDPDSGGGGSSSGDPKTPEQLRVAREDAKNARLDRDRYRKELDGLRGEYTRFRTESETALEALKASHTTELEKVRIDLNGKAAAAEKAAADATEKAKTKVTMADLRIAARESGMLDLDGLKLLDLAEAKLDDDGNVTNAADLMTAMKEAKPYLFGKAPEPGTVTGTTTNTTKPPVPAKPGAFDARTATVEEYTAHKASMLKGAR